MPTTTANCRFTVLGQRNQALRRNTPCLAQWAHEGTEYAIFQVDRALLEGVNADFTDFPLAMILTIDSDHDVLRMEVLLDSAYGRWPGGSMNIIQAAAKSAKEANSLKAEAIFSRFFNELSLPPEQYASLLTEATDYTLAEIRATGPVSQAHIAHFLSVQGRIGATELTAEAIQALLDQNLIEVYDDDAEIRSYDVKG